MVHKGLVDVKLWSRMPDQKHIRERFWYLIGDGVYLLGTLIMFIAWGLVCYFSELLFWELARYSAIGTLLGSQAWDLIFGYVIDNDPFYPFGDWYGGWGFSGKKSNRYLFDTIRVSLAITLLFI